MRLMEIARATHEINRTYCQILGDDSQVPWEDAPAWQRESAINGVGAILEGKAKTAEEMHDLWAIEKLEKGWTHGKVKDPEAKTHPCMVPYAELPPEQRAKDDLFRIVATALLHKEAIRRNDPEDGPDPKKVDELSRL